MESASTDAHATPSSATQQPPPQPEKISANWRAQSPALIAAFARVTATSASDAAASQAAHANLASALLIAHRGGVFRMLQSELPKLFAATGKPIDTLAALLTRLQPRIAAEKQAPATGRNAKQNARAGAKAGAQAIAPPAAADAAIAEDAAAASAVAAPSSSNSLPLPSGLSDDWFSQLTSATSFECIGNSHHHSLQLLLLASVSALNLTPSAEQQTRAREQLMPLWIQVPSVVQPLLSVFKFMAEGNGSGTAASSSSSSVAASADSALVPPAALLYYFHSLTSRGHHADAAQFLLGFPDAALTASLLSAAGGPASVIGPLLTRKATMGWDTIAVGLADAHEALRDTCIRLLCTSAYKSPTSLKCIQKWGMDPASFPEVTHDLASRQLHWLVREGKALELGSEVCGSDVKLQTLLVRQLLHAGELEQAEEIIDQFNLRSNAELIAELTQHQADRAAGLTKAPTGKSNPAASSATAGPFLRMPASIPITFVTSSDPSSLQRAAEGLSEAQTDAVGLDLEFGFTGSSSNQPALLQIATRSQVFLFDLLCFADCESMGLTLQRLFTSPRIRKIGYAWDGDWKVLRSGFPSAVAFRAQTNVLDMADPARALDRWEATQEAEKEAADRKRRAMEKNAATEEASAVVAAAAAGAGAASAAPVAVPADADNASPDEPADAAEAEDDDDDDDAMDDCGEPVNELAASAAAIKQSVEAAECDSPTAADAAADTSAASSSSASQAAPPSASASSTIASPSREARRKAKKVVKKAARNALKAATAAAAADDTSAAPVVRKGIARGLSSLAALCLGLPLDKRYQISAWRRRPLKPEQLHYAALDAFCLLGIRDAFFDAHSMHPMVRQAQIGEEEQFVQYDAANNTAASSSAAAASALSTSTSAAAPSKL